MVLLGIAGWIVRLGLGGVLVVFALAVYANSEAAERAAWRAIEKECARLGCEDVEAFTNSRSSYGVWYRKGGTKYRGKCTVGLLGKVGWLKNDPAKVP